MILMQVRTWFGPSRARIGKEGAVGPIETMDGIASRLTLPQALRALRDYENEYERTYTQTAVNFNVVGVQEIPELTDEELELGRIELVEDKLAWIKTEEKRG